MCFAFGCLLVFLVVHRVEHRFFDSVRALLLRNNWQSAYFLHVPKERIETLDIWKSKEYFVGGAIAFQFLVSTVVYILISANVLSRASGTHDD